MERDRGVYTGDIIGKLEWNKQERADISLQVIVVGGKECNKIKKASVSKKVMDQDEIESDVIDTAEQWYQCYTCGLVCRRVCFRDHNVTYSKHESFFCDCRAKEYGSCSDLSPRFPLDEELKRKRSAISMCWV